MMEQWGGGGRSSREGQGRAKGDANKDLKLSYVGIQGDDPDGVVGQSDGQEPAPLLADGNVSQRHADDVARHVFPLGVLVQLPRLERK